MTEQHTHDHDYAHDHDHAHDDDHGHAHEHEHDHDHDHEHDHEHVVMTHLGMSVGTATMQFMGLGLTLEVPHEHAHDQHHGEADHDHGHAHHEHGGVRVAERRVFYRRPAVPIPYLADGRLDIGALGFAILEAGTNSPRLGDDIDGRVAVLTGQAAEEENAYWIGRALIDIDYRSWVLLRAGPHLEAVLAAYGADAVSRSIDPHGEPRAVLNVDVGGSTVNFALCQDGAVAETTALAVGTRVIAFGADGKVEAIRPAGATLAGAAEVQIAIGTEPDGAVLRKLADRIAESVFDVLERRELHPVTQSLMLGSPLTYSGRINAVSFTGGAAEYVYENQEQGFGDLGPLIGRALRLRTNRLGMAVQEPEHLSRAALVGGIQYHVHDPHDRPHFAEPAAFTAARERDQTFLATAPPDKSLIRTP